MWTNLCRFTCLISVIVYTTFADEHNHVVSRYLHRNLVSAILTDKQERKTLENEDTPFGLFHLRRSRTTGASTVIKYSREPLVIEVMIKLMEIVNLHFLSK